MRKRWFNAILIGLTIAIASVGCGTSDSKSHEKVTAKEAKKLIDNQEVTIIDVRTQEEFESGHIPESRLLPLQELPTRLDELDKDTTYLIVCRSGNRSGQAQTLLKDAGFKKTYNLIGGVTVWPYSLVTD